MVIDNDIEIVVIEYVIVIVIIIAVAAGTAARYVVAAGMLLLLLLQVVGRHGDHSSCCIHIHMRQMLQMMLQQLRGWRQRSTCHIVSIAQIVEKLLLLLLVLHVAAQQIVVARHIEIRVAGVGIVARVAATVAGQQMR